jgi:hypothetical protein
MPCNSNCLYQLIHTEISTLKKKKTIIIANRYYSTSLTISKLNIVATTSTISIN